MEIRRYHLLDYALCARDACVSKNSGGVCCKNSKSKVITSASFITVPLGLEVVCITSATTVDKFDTFVLLEKRTIIIVQQMNGVNKF